MKPFQEVIALVRWNIWMWESRMSWLRTVVDSWMRILTLREEGEGKKEKGQKEKTALHNRISLRIDPSSKEAASNVNQLMLGIHRPTGRAFCLDIRYLPRYFSS